MIKATLRMDVLRCKSSPMIEKEIAVGILAYNLGAGWLQTSTLRRRINQRDWEGAARELLRWVNGGGRVLPGLVARRRCEVALLR
mgnify:CR=1 FL=1